MKIHSKAKVYIGNNVTLNSRPKGYHAGMPFPITLIADKPGSMIYIGDNSRLHGCCIHAWSRIDIGQNCLIAAGSQILDSHGHTSDLADVFIRSNTQDDPKPIVIEDYCWLGLGSIILKGVHLGKGSIIGANSVLSEGNYPPFSLICGNPGKVIKTLDQSEINGHDGIVL